MQLVYQALANYLTADPERIDRLIAYAKRTPYSDLGDYMGRYWVFNAFEDQRGNRIDRNWLMNNVVPSARIHHIQRPDGDRHLHNHPWNAQRIVLRGWYTEELEGTNENIWRWLKGGSDLFIRDWSSSQALVNRTLRAGDTAPLRAGEFHRISEVSEGGVWTLFITGRWRNPWGFKMDDGSFMQWRDYLAMTQKGY